VKSDFRLSIGMVAEEIALEIFSHNLFLSNDYANDYHPVK